MNTMTNKRQSTHTQEVPMLVTFNHEQVLEVMNSQPRIDCNPIQCQCFGNGPRPVFQEGGTGRWFILMGHCGFNSRRNNLQGFTTEKGARGSIAHYQRKGMVARGEI